MSATADTLIDLDAKRQAVALSHWVDSCKMRMSARWPLIKFDSAVWPIKSKYNTTLRDVNFEPSLRDFSGKDSAYGIALKCLMAEIAMKGDIKIPSTPMRAWRHLSKLDVPLHQVRSAHLTQLESALVERARLTPGSASRWHGDLLTLRLHLDVLSTQEVTESLTWSVAPQTKTELLALSRSSALSFRETKRAILDRQIEALSDAQAAMLRNDSRLSAQDRVALAVMGLNMCCPNRVNEPLCMAADDRFTLEDYLSQENQSGFVTGDPSRARVHQMLLVKGSKGAAWGAKPVLNFMIDFADYCIEVIKRHGERSRTLVTWYEEHPNRLYLPPDLEELRGSDISRTSLWQIMTMQNAQPKDGEANLVKYIWAELHTKGLVKESRFAELPVTANSKNGKPSTQVVAWADLEPVLLARVHTAMKELRRVTVSNHYSGRLSNMLALFDSESSAYLPDSMKYATLKRRLLLSESDKRPGKGNAANWAPPPTLFEKLGLKMVVNGVVKTAYIHTHDPRRWLTTQALDAGLPDVVANKWANRLNIEQLKHYDVNTPERKAQRAAMPAVKELEDLTEGLQKLGSLESDYGLKTDLIVVDNANIALTSMDEIMRATGERPIARTSNQILILYPQRYGACLHQHHERPCRSYKCAPCNEGVVVKGHLPTNERIRRDADSVFRSIVNQLEALLIARHRQLADSPDVLDEHILTLVREGLGAEDMARDLISRFHDIKEQISDRAFANQLAESFALQGYVSRLNDESVSAGALIKYHNPGCHAAPGHERAMEARHGGRDAVKVKMEAFDLKYPQFSQTALGKKDQRELLQADEDDRQEPGND